MKKKLIFVLSVLFSVAACKVDMGETMRVSRESLYRYSEGLFNELVYRPAIGLDAAYRFSMFLELTPEEQKDSPYYPYYVKNVEQTDVFTYFFEGIGTIYTKGRPFDSEGAEWTVCGNEVRYEGENVWNVKYRKIGEDMCGYDGVDAHIVVRLQNPEDDASATYKWEVTASGNDDDGGIVACFTTGETPAVIGNMQPYTSNPEYCVYSGRFVVDMYKGDGKIDYCYMSFDDGEMEFDTSRD